MTTVVELQERQGKILAELEAMQSRGIESRTEEWRKGMADLEKIEEQIELAKEQESVRRRVIELQDKADSESRQRKTSNEENEKRMSYDAVFGRWMTRAKNATMTADDLSVLEARGTNTQITTTNSLGGYLVPQSFSNELEAMGLWSGGMMEACRIYDDTIGGTLPWPTADDTSVSGEISGQGTAATVSDLTIGNVLFTDYTIDSKIVKVARELIRDERVGLLQTVLAELLAERLSRKVNSVLTNGTGTSEPYGLTVASTSTGLTTASATAITASELVNMLYSVDKYYSTGNKVAWMMHRTTLAYLRTLDFTTNTTHLFADRVIAGEPDMLLGYPVIINNDLPATSGGAPVAATKHIYFGDFSKYVIRRIGGVTIDRNDSVYWTSRTAGFMGWLSLDGNLLNQNAIKALKTHA